jgi:hypothetical protein
MALAPQQDQAGAFPGTGQYIFQQYLWQMLFIVMFPMFFSWSKARFRAILKI